MSKREWTSKAKCKGMDTNFFFPDERDKRDTKKINKAKEFCVGCPVLEECLTYAIDNDIRVGVFGGMSRKQRRLESRMRKIKQLS